MTTTKGATTLTEPITSTQPIKATDTQVGGDHYKKYKIQPIEYAYANGMGALEHGVIKYVTRHRDKGKAEDIRKAIHYCKLILQFEYNEHE